MTKLLFFLPPTLLYAASAQTNKAAQTPWKQYTYPGDGFAIVAPVAPTMPPDVMAPHGRLYRFQITSDVRLLVRSAELANCAEKLAELRKTSLQPRTFQPVTPGSVKDISLQGNRGLEMESTTREGDKILERFYCVNDAVFILNALYPGRRAKPATVDRLLDSFRFVKP